MELSLACGSSYPAFGLRLLGDASFLIGKIVFPFQAAVPEKNDRCRNRKRAQSMRG
jgi:hypothetical protein